MSSFIRFSLLTLLVLSLQSAFAQQADKLFPGKLNEAKLEARILHYVNELRDSLGLETLSNDRILAKAAKDQSIYCYNVRKLTHDQETYHKEHVYNRVEFYGGTHAGVGENVAFIGWPSGSSKDDSPPTYDSIAHRFFLNWKNSPGHYANMVTPEFRFSGIRFTWDQNKKRLYAAHVFGGADYEPPRGISVPKFAYGIKAYDADDCAKTDEFRWSADHFANGVYVEGDSIYLWYHDLNYFKKVISSHNDAIAIDIVERRQFPCAADNELHGSMVHDGVMLPPVYHYELYQKNTEHERKHVRVNLGALPKGIKGQLNANVIVIRDQQRCRYSYPVTVPWSDLPLFRFNPIYDTIDGPITPDTIAVTVDEYVPFRQGIYTFDAKSLSRVLERLHQNKEYIKAIHVDAYSSVEGSEGINLHLQEQRANSIIKVIRDYGLEVVPITHQAIENWEQFFEQIEGTEYAYLKDESKGRIKQILTRKKVREDLEPLLSQQRTAHIQIELRGEYGPETQGEATVQAYRHAVSKGNIANARALQTRLIRYAYATQDKDLLHKVWAVGSTPHTQPFLPVIQNQMAAYEAIGGEPYQTDSTYQLYLDSLTRIDSCYVPMHFTSLVHSIKAMWKREDAPFPPSHYQDKLFALRDTVWFGPIPVMDEESWYRLMINFHLAAVKYYWEHLEYENKHTSMQAIRDYFVKADMTVEEAVAMAQYFNKNHYFEWSLDVLKKWADQPLEGLNEEAIFTYAQTLSLFRDGALAADLQYYLQQARLKNRDRFCKWINHDFQLMRHPTIKSIFCTECKDYSPPSGMRQRARN